MARTARRDSNYVIYEMRDQHGHNYIGLTRKGPSTARKAVLERWRRHLSRARCEDRAWALYQYLRTRETEWTHTVLEIVRGRALAYAREREIVKRQAPSLNSQYL
jgi:hypothetical protein